MKSVSAAFSIGHDKRSAVALFAVLHAVFLGVLLWVESAGRDARFVVDVGWMVASVWAVAEWANTLRRERRTAGLWFGGSALCYLVAVIIWAIVDLGHAAAPYPSPADFFYLLTPLFLVTGLFWLRPGDVIHGYRPLQTANLGLVAAATTILATFSIAPLVAGSPDGFLYVATTVAYWAVYLTAGTFTVLAIIGFSWRDDTRVVALLAAAMVVFVVAALPYAYDLIDHKYVAGTWYDVLWFLAPCILALAARDFGPQTAAPAVELHAVPQTARLVPSFLMAGTVFALGFSEAKNLGGVPGTFLVAAAGVIAVALTLRERAVKNIEGVLEKRLRAALWTSQENEKRFKDFAEATSDFFLETDENLIIRRVIKGPESSLAVTPEWLIGRRVIQTTDAGAFERNPAANEALAVMIRRESFRNFEYKLTAKDGREVWRHYSGAPFYDGAGNFSGYRVSYQDITPQKHLEAENAAKKDELARVIETMPGAFYRAATHGGNDMLIEYISPRIATILGYSPAELINQPELDLAPPGEAKLTFALIVTRGNWVSRSERKLRLRRSDGRIVTVLEKTAMVEPRPDGRIVFEGLLLDITDLERRDVEIVQGRRRLDLAVEHLPGWLYATSINEHGQQFAVYRSSGVERITGYAAEDFRNLVMNDPVAIVHPDDKQILAEILRRPPNPDEVHECTYRIVTRDGEIRWIRDRVRITKGADSILIDGLALDISDRVARDARESRRSRLNAVAERLIGGKNALSGDLNDSFRAMTEEAAVALDASRVGIWLFDDADRQSVTLADLYDRRSGQHAAGTTITRAQFPEHFEGLDKGAPVIMNAAVPEAGAAPVKKAMENLGITTAINTPIFRDGVQVGAASFARSEPGPPWDRHEIAFATSFSDTISLALEAAERRAAEAKVRATNAELARVVHALDSALEQITIVDADNRVTYLNAEADRGRATVGQFPAIGRHYREVFPNVGQGDRDRIAAIKAEMADRGTWSGEIAFVRDGRDRFLDVRAAALADGGTIFAAIDITDRKLRERNEEALRNRLAQAEKMEAIGKLAGGIAHDFNNLIAAIRSFAGLIVYDLPVDHPDRTYAERILGTSDRAAELVRQILLFARAGSAEREAVSVSNIFEEFQPLLASALPAGVTLRIAPPGEEAVIDVNAGQLLQVLLNLGINAADAIGDGNGGAIQVSCQVVTLSEGEAADLGRGLTVMPPAAGRDAEILRYGVGTFASGQAYVRIAVQDNGPGMTGDVARRIYEPFFTTKDKTKGTGLGLAVVNSIVATHGGAIVLTTGRWSGTRFEIMFPRSENLPKVSAARKDPGSVRGNERVLIVDDEIDLADAMSLALQKLGYETAPIYGSAEALEIFSEDPSAWDVVVTDQVMPDMSGLELTRKLKRLNAGVEIILCTGYSDSATEKKAKQAGAAAFLHKPAAPEQIAQIIRRSLDRKAANL